MLEGGTTIITETDLERHPGHGLRWIFAQLQYELFTCSDRVG